MKLLLVFFQSFPLKRELIKALEKKFECKVKAINSKEPNARNRFQQFLADDFLPEINFLREKEKSDFALALIEKDLFSGSLNFVFGVASIPLNACIVSWHRLKSDSKEVFFERVFKECVHELGHLLGLQHCSNKKCVMSFSNSLNEADYKNTEFCPKCLEKLKEIN